MTTLTQQDVSIQTAPARETALPGFRRLASMAGAAVGLPVALCLIVGKLWLAASFAGGALLSLLVCGMLYGFVSHGMAMLAANPRNPSAHGGSTAAFGALLAAKFVVLGLAGYALMSLRQINLPCVLVGFMLAQTAIVITAMRHFNKPLVSAPPFRSSESR